MQAFARRPRLPRSSPQWDRQEVEWWDANAGHIERIWGLPDALCRGARQSYLESIRARFLQLKAARPLRILEIACGSGWPGRLLASPALKVTGVDFSEEQIKIARVKAEEAGQSNCDYVQMEIGQMSESFQLAQFDGVFIHCGIHHLSTIELTGFVDLLSRSPNGFPTVLVEPVYLDRSNIVGRLLGWAFTATFYLLGSAYFARCTQDKILVKTTQDLVNRAADEGWFFSPKEVPFDIDEIRHLFAPHFEINEIEPVTYFGLRAAQYLATLKDQQKASRLGARFLPILNWIDRLLIRTGSLPKLTSNYLFCRIVLIRR
jgi:SAM-dependent methyltransferase